MSRLNVGIVCGGCSLEHEVSLKSAICIAQRMDKSRFAVLVLWIDKRGNWYLIKDMCLSGVYCSNQIKKLSISLNRFSNRCSFCFSNTDDLLNIDVIFPIVHGVIGEDGALQGLLRIMNLPYVGSNVLGSSICMDKDITNRLLRDAGLPIIPFKTFLINDREKIKFDDLVDVFGLSLFVKPVNQGSSLGVSKVNDKDEFDHALDVAFSLSRKIMIEPVIVGRELECAVLGNDNPKSSVCGEIIVRNDSFYTYDSKYIQHNSDIIIPAMIDNEISDRVRYISIRAFQVLNCFGMARVDVFLTPNDQIIINEVNTLPGFTINSMYPKLWEMTGLCIQLLLTKLIELALDHYRSEAY